MKRVWIIGAGKFGRNAADKIKRCCPSSELTVVDSDASLCRKLARIFPKTVCSDGAAYLLKHLDNDAGPDWIIPAIPRHVAYDWVTARLSQITPVVPLSVPDGFAKQLPNVIKGEDGQVYASHADFICPDECDEPVKICMHTGKSRPDDLFHMLETTACCGFTPVVIRSRQLFPGVGGYSAQDLYRAFDRILTLEGPVLLATACRCHGVIHAFELKHKETGF